VKRCVDLPISANRPDGALPMLAKALTEGVPSTGAPAPADSPN